MPVTSDTQIPRGEVSHGGRYWTHPIWGNTISAYEPEAIELSTYDEMRRTDETIKAGLQFAKLTVLSKLGSYQHEDEKVKEFVDTALDVMEGTVEGFVSDLLSAMWAGYAVAELVYDLMPSGKFKGRAYYRKVKVLHPMSVWPNGIKSDGKGNVEKIVQSEGQPGEAVLEKGKFLHMTYDGGGPSFGSPFGSSMLRAVHKWWFAKDLCTKLWMMYMEKFGVPLLTGFAPQGVTECPVDGDTESYALAMLHMLQAWNTKTEMVFPAAVDPATGGYIKEVPRIEMFSPQASSGEVFENFVRYADTAILLGLLIPAQTLSEAKFGTRAQSQTHLDAFLGMLADLQRIIADVLTEKFIRPLLILNFAGLDNYGKWVPEPLTEEDKKGLADNLFKMIQGGAIDPGSEAFREWVLAQFAPDVEYETPPEEAPPEEAPPEKAPAPAAEEVPPAEMEPGQEVPTEGG